MDRVNGLNWVDIGAGRRGFRGRNASIGLAGTEVTEKFLNDVQEEIAGLIERGHGGLDSGDQLQLLKAIRSGRLNFAEAGGTANALVVTLDPVMAGHVVGMQLCVQMAAPNTGAVTLNEGGGVLPVQLRGGANVAAGAWQAGDLVRMTCTGTAWSIDTVLTPGFATLAETIAGLVANKVIAPDVLAKAVQRGGWNYAVAGGTANALVVATTPALAAHVAGMPLRVMIAATNTGAATLNAGPGALPIVTLRGTPVAASDLPAGAVMEFLCTGAAWMLVGQAYSEIGTSAYAVYGAAGTYTWVAPARVSKVRARLWGGGGGGGGASSGGVTILASGGGGGAYGESVCAVVPGQSYTVIVGAGGAGGPGGSGAANGANGGLSSFGSFVTALGGGYGLASTSGVQPTVGAAGVAGAADYARPGLSGGLGWPSVDGSTGANIQAQGGGAYQTGYTATYVAGKSVSLAGAPGNAPAGGAGGGMCGGAGGNGAAGMVILEY